MSELNKIIDDLGRLNKDNGPKVDAGTYRVRKDALKGKIHQYNTHNGTDIRLTQPVQGVRAFKLLGMAG